SFVSGLILLIERPIKVGDWVDLSGTSGRVTNIGARSTTVVTPDNITIILPNGDCLANQIINWSFGDTRIRFRIPVGVAYGSDMDKVEKALLEAGAEHPNVLDDPAPKVLFDAFGDSSLNLELAVWIKAGTIGAQQLRSDLNFAIDRKFRQADVEIPFPQRDLNFRNLLTMSN
ncbi:MAG: mechanosensitive ion channel, partial [Candidatus Eremiobacteraeota bacterium]|nr:mechanosensitive ion channel [Candidatus Eremiobacteraeota bacterium]